MPCATAANDTLTIAKAVAMARTPANMPGTPRTTDFSPTLRPRESRKQSLAGAVRPWVLAIFADVSIRSHRSGARANPAAGVRAGPGTKAESSFRGHVIDPLGAAAASRQISEPRRRCRVAVSGIEESRGPRLVGKSDAYRRYARECLEMASAVSDPRAPREPAADGAGMVSLGRARAARRRGRIPSGRRLKARFLGRVRERLPR